MIASSLTTLNTDWTVATPDFAPPSRGGRKSKTAARRTEQPRWDTRAAHREVRATLERLASSFPESYNFADDASRWTRLEAAIERAFRRENWRALRTALEHFEAEVRVMFAEAASEPVGEQYLPPPSQQLELWFDELPG